MEDPLEKLPGRGHQPSPDPADPGPDKIRQRFSPGPAEQKDTSPPPESRAAGPQQRSRHPDRVSAEPSTSGSEDKIVIPEDGQFPYLDDYCFTILHELVHWTGRNNRLKRTYACPSLEEVITKLGSCFLAWELGFTSHRLFRLSRAYIQHMDPFVKRKYPRVDYEGSWNRATEAAIFLLAFRPDDIPA